MHFASYLKISLALAFVASFASRLYISWDGYLYLSSAKSLFTPEFSTNYHWLREPLYPFFLWLVNSLFGKSDVFFALSNLLVLAIACSFAAWSLQFNKRLFLVFVSIIFISSITVGIAGSILQQSLLSSLVLSLLALIRLSDDSYNFKKKLKFKIEYLTIFICGLGCTLSLLFVPVVLSVLLANTILFSLYINTLSTKKSIRFQTGSLIAKFFPRTLLMTLLILLPLACWNFFKINVAQDTYGVFKPFVSTSNVLGSFAEPGVTKLQIAGGLTSLSADIDGISFDKSEIKTFGLGLENTYQAERCGFYNDGYPQAIEYVRDYISSSCKTDFIWQFFVYLQPISLFLFRFFLVSSPLIFLYFLYKRNLRFACLFLPIVTTFGVYFSLGLGISRYMYAVWPATVFYFMSLIAWRSDMAASNKYIPKQNKMNKNFKSRKNS